MIDNDTFKVNRNGVYNPLTSTAKSRGFRIAEYDDNDNLAKCQYVNVMWFIPGMYNFVVVINQLMNVCLFDIIILGMCNMNECV